MTRTEKWQVTAALLIAATMYALLWLYLRPLVFRGSHADFGCFYRAGRMLCSGAGAQTYNLAAQQHFDTLLGTAAQDPAGRTVSLPFVFPPFVLVVFAPLSWLPYRAAELTWYVLNVGALLVAPFFVPTRLGWRKRLVAVSLLLPLTFLPVILALMQGQPSIALLLLFGAAFLDLEAGHDTRAGLWLALATFKPQLVLPILPALLLWRKYRALETFVLTCGALTIVSALLVGWAATWSYPLAPVRFNTMPAGFGGEHPASMPNLRGALYLLLHNCCSERMLQMTVVVLTVAVVAVPLLLQRCERRLTAGMLSLWVILSLVSSYHAYLHDACLLLIPALLSFQAIRSAAPAVRIVLTALLAALFLVPLLPGSLSTTAMELFVLMMAWIGLLAWQSWITAAGRAMHGRDSLPS